MDARLKREKLFEANLLEFIDQSAIATDLEGFIFYWGSGAETLYGWKEEEVIERNVLDVLPTSLSRSEAEAAMALLRNARPWFGEIQVQDKSGNRFLAHVTDLPIRSSEGHLLGILGLSARSSPDEPMRAAENGSVRHSLTSRQLEVLGLIGRGFTNAEIAAELSLSTNTVKIHVSAILARLGLKTRSQAAVVAGRVLARQQAEVPSVPRPATPGV